MYVTPSSSQMSPAGDHHRWNFCPNTRQWKNGRINMIERATLCTMYLH